MYSLHAEKIKAFEEYMAPIRKRWQSAVFVMFLVECNIFETLTEYNSFLVEC